MFILVSNNRATAPFLAVSARLPASNVPDYCVIHLFSIDPACASLHPCSALCLLRVRTDLSFEAPVLKHPAYRPRVSLEGNLQQPTPRPRLGLKIKKMRIDLRAFFLSSFPSHISFVVFTLNLYERATYWFVMAGIDKSVVRILARLDLDAGKILKFDSTISRLNGR